MSEFEIDKHLQSLNSERLRKEIEEEEEELGRKIEWQKQQLVNEEQMNIGKSIVQDLVEKSNVIQLMHEINARAFNNRRKMVAGITLVHPDRVQTWSYRIEFGPTHTNEEKQPAHTVYEIVLQDKKKKKNDRDDMKCTIGAKKNGMSAQCTDWVGYIRLNYMEEIRADYRWIRDQRRVSPFHFVDGEVVYSDLRIIESDLSSTLGRYAAEEIDRHKKS